jgi:hypothetical protein
MYLPQSLDDLPTALTIVHCNGTHPIPPQYTGVGMGVGYLDLVQNWKAYVACFVESCLCDTWIGKTLLRGARTIYREHEYVQSLLC